MTPGPVDCPIIVTSRAGLRLSKVSLSAGAPAAGPTRATVTAAGPAGPAAQAGRKEASAAAPRREDRPPAVGTAAGRRGGRWEGPAAAACVPGLCAGGPFWGPPRRRPCGVAIDKQTPRLIYMNWLGNPAI